jgi:hypothetical protein
LDTFFISPKFHGGALLGGWWYSVPEDMKLIGVPAKVFGIMPPSSTYFERANLRLDLDLVRMIGRQLLGDEAGNKLANMKDVPAGITNWLKCSSSGKAINDYELWKKILDEGFGPPKFIKMNLTVEDLYKN